MTDDEHILRAETAAQFLENAVLGDIFQELTDDTIERLTALEASMEFDDERRALCLKLQVIRDVRDTLRSYITTGKQVAGRGSQYA